MGTRILLQAEKVELETTVVDEMQSQDKNGKYGLNHHGIVAIVPSM